MARRRQPPPAADPEELLSALPLDGAQCADLRTSGLLELALTHRSWAFEHDTELHNERLEFLGDAVLQLAVTERLYTDHPALREGDLARRRAATVSTRALAMIGRRIGLGAYVRLGRGEALSGGREKPSILADTMEALIGAVHLACGQNVSRRYVLAMMDPLLSSDAMLEAGYDFKTRLQEIAAETATVPRYEISQGGPEHDPVFTASVHIDGVVSATAEGPSKKEAELAAAQRAVRSLLAERGETVFPSS